MRYAIVYSSRTGNTAQLTQAIREALPQEEECLYFGTPDSQALKAEILYVGFWTDKGTCDEDTAVFLKRLTNQKVFLFGIAGFGWASGYFEKILDRVQNQLRPGVQLGGDAICVRAKCPGRFVTGI